MKKILGFEMSTWKSFEIDGVFDLELAKVIGINKKIRKI